MLLLARYTLLQFGIFDGCLVPVNYISGPDTREIRTSRDLSRRDGGKEREIERERERKRWGGERGRNH